MAAALYVIYFAFHNTIFVYFLGNFFRTFFSVGKVTFSMLILI